MKDHDNEAKKFGISKAFTYHMLDIMERHHVTTEEAEILLIQALMSNMIISEIRDQVDFLVEEKSKGPLDEPASHF